jgi:hypothetical protein
MVALYVAATVVTLMQFLRRHERRLLPLLALFACMAVARGLEAGSRRAAVFEVAAIASGLVLLAMLTPRHSAVR